MPFFFSFHFSTLCASFARQEQFLKRVYPVGIDCSLPCRPRSEPQLWIWIGAGWLAQSDTTECIIELDGFPM